MPMLGADVAAAGGDGEGELMPSSLYCPDSKVYPSGMVLTAGLGEVLGTLLSSVIGALNDGRICRILRLPPLLLLLLLARRSSLGCTSVSCTSTS